MSSELTTEYAMYSVTAKEMLSVSESRKRTIKSRVNASQDLLNHLSPGDRIRFWNYGGGITTPVPFDLIHDAFRNQALLHPDNVAVECNDVSITYAELDHLSGKLAAELIQRGIQTGDIVPLFLERSVSMVVGIIAVLKVGASYAPQHVGVAPDSQLAHISKLVDAKVVLTLSRFHSRVEAATDRPCVSIDRFTDGPGTREMDQVIPMNGRTRSVQTDDVALVLFTSGTTGVPNGVKVTHRNLCNILLLAPGNMGIRAGTRVSQLLSIAFDMAAWEILGCLGNGGTLLIRGKDIPATARRANVIIATPSILSRIPCDECKDVEFVAVAGEPCPRSLADEWSMQCTFYNSCGPTETTIVNTMLAHCSTNVTLSIGRPTPNNTVYILNEDRLPCRIGEVGEMWAGGDCVSAGYLDNEELTKERYSNDPFLGGEARMFNTRDLGRWTADGTLEHLGRTDDQVKIRGFRVELDAVATVLESVDTCTRATAIKIDDRNLVGFVSPGTVDAKQATAAVERSLPYYCVPETVHVLDELPLTSRGKIDKRQLLAIAKKYREMGTFALSEITDDKSDAETTTGSVNKRTNTPVVNDESGVDKKSSAGDNNAEILTPEELAMQRRLDEHALESDKRIAQYKQSVTPDAPNSMRAKLTHHRFYHYWRLVTMIGLVNLLVLGYAVFSGGWFNTDAIRLDLLLNVAVANLTVAIVFRQQYVVNILFGIATSTPLWAPLRFRQLMGKVYHFGGIHIGGAVFGSLWMLIAIVTMFIAVLFKLPGTHLSSLTLFAATQLVLVLMLLLVTANPATRQKFHNSFEIVHRFGGWFSLALFWAVAISFINDSRSGSFSGALFSSGVFWALVLVTISIILPWLRLRRVPVELVRPSNHVVLANFDYGVTPFAGSSTAISRSPLTEWHSFANVPAPGKSGFRLTISRAGDWTGQLIDDLPDHIWVKGIPTAGVGNVDQLFKRVVWVATGSGIGPTLPHLLSQEVPAHLIWSTRNARETYGDGLVDEIVQVEPNAVIWDTNTHGRPDLVQMAYAAVQDFDAEAVIVIANEKLTRLVVHNMEARGIPAYGAIWDS